MIAALSWPEVEALSGGRHGVIDAACPVCGPSRRNPHNRVRKVLRMWRKEPDYATYACARSGLSGWAHQRGRSIARSAGKASTSTLLPSAEPDRQLRIDLAAELWRKSAPLGGTPGESYFVRHRNLDIGHLDLGHALRWHGSINGVVALMTDPVTGAGSGCHRTFLNSDGNKRERKMLGRQGVIRLSRDEDVTHGLGVVEGVEDGLAVLLGGWSPIWAATSAGAIARLPVLAGIETLTIFADVDDVGSNAALTCAARWRAAGSEVRIVPPGGVHD